MLLNELATSSDTKIRKINQVLKETFGFTLVSEVESGKLNTLYTKISDDLYDLKLDLSTVKSPDYMQKVLVLEGLRLLIEKNKLEEGLRHGPGGNAYEKVNKWLSEFVHNACEVGDDYEEAIRDAMKQYRSSKYRFLDAEVEQDLRKVTYECSSEGVEEYTSASYPMVEEKECTKCECDPCECEKINEEKECTKCECDPCECDKIEEAEFKFPKKLNYTTTTTHHGDGTSTTKKYKPPLMSFKNWQDKDPKEVMSLAYWLKRQLPPSDPEAYASNWENLKAQLEVKYPQGELEEGGDRHASREWVQDIKQTQGIDDQPGYYDPEAGELSLSVEDPETQPEAEDFFSYRSKQKRTEMKEGYVKQLRKLLEAETDQAESLIAAKSFSQELQDMIEKLGRLVNEDLPAVSVQMRDAYGSDVATGFEDQVSNTLNAVMDSLRNSKQEIDNSVSSIADGGVPTNDMDGFSDEELGGEFDDEGLDLDGDMDLELGDELGDEFGGDDAMAGDIEEPLGRAKKEALIVIGNKLVETKAKLARIKARS